MRHGLTFAVLSERVHVVREAQGVRHGELGEALRELRRDPAPLLFRHLLRDRDDVALQAILQRRMPPLEVPRAVIRVEIQRTSVPLEHERIQLVRHLRVRGSDASFKIAFRVCRKFKCVLLDHVK